ncbi:MAG: HAD family hydrolase [Pseudomonadota bacterium]
MPRPLLPGDAESLRLVVFDWDGTLMDSPRRIIWCLRHASRTLGVEVLPEARLRDIIGLGVEVAVRRLYPDADDAFVEEFTATYRRCYLGSGDAPETPLYAGARALLNWLDQAGFLLAVATSKSRPGLDQALADSGLEDLFVVTATSDEYPSKPNPAMLEAVIRATGVECANTRMIGDSVYDLEMARNAGVPAIAVTHGVHSAGRLREVAPLALVKDLSELHERLQAAWSAGS